MKIVKIAIWDERFDFITGLELGVPPGGDYGGQGGLSFYVGAKVR